MSTCDATIRRSSFSTSSTVSARSSGVDGVYSTVSMGWQRSTAMMSAPSSASRIACDRPWPRAAPVMKATLPSTLPTIVLLLSVAEELPQLADEQLGLLGRGKVPASRQLRPALHVVVVLGDPTGGAVQLFREHRHAGRHRHPPRRRAQQPGPRRLVIQPG